MALEREYKRPYQRNETESLQNIIIKYVQYKIKSTYPQTKIHSMVEEHVRKSVPYSGGGEYRLDYRSKDNEKPWGVATIYHPPLFQNHNKKNGKKMVTILTQSIN